MWSEVENGGYATQHLITRPKVRVSAICYLPGVKSPLHTHPHHDQCVALAQGSVELITDNEIKKFEAGQAMIIPAGMAHGFISGTEGVRFLSVFIGDGASEPGKTVLPDRISKLIDPKTNKHEKLVETFLSPEQVGDLEDLNQAEQETLVWVVDRLLKRIETGRLKKRGQGKFRKPRRAQEIRAWQKDESYFLFSPIHRMVFSLSIKHGKNINDYVNFNAVDVYWPSLERLPEVEKIK